MTIKLYDTNPYDRTFTAVIRSCRKAESAGGAETGEVRYAVTLDQTLFFPEEGGQTPDTGVLTPLDSRASKPSAAVLDVQIEGDEIVHYCSIPLEPGSSVTGRIDWDHRFDNMQQHTGEHIVSGLARKYYQLTNVGFHLSNDTVTMDYDGELTAEQIEKLESCANRAIWENHTVTAWYPPADELASLDYRSKIDLADGVRLVRIEGVDLCACCAPHVRTTGEVGLLKIIDYRRYKGGMRLWIVCGGRALADYRMLHEQSAGISFDLSAPRDQLDSAVKARLREIEALKTAHAEAGAALLAARISAVPDDQKHAVLFEDSISDDRTIRDALNELASGRTGYCAAFYNPQGAADGSGPSAWRYICASTGSDCRTFNSLLKESFEVRGGGKEGMVQGSVTADRAELEAWTENTLN